MQYHISDNQLSRPQHRAISLVGPIISQTTSLGLTISPITNVVGHKISQITNLDGHNLQDIQFGRLIHFPNNKNLLFSRSGNQFSN